jgi:hypothetical protein
MWGAETGQKHEIQNPKSETNTKPKEENPKRVVLSL